MNASSNCEKQFANHKLDTHTLAKDLDAECEGKYEADTCADSNGERGGVQRTQRHLTQNMQA
eukprot:4100219-Amphidinium_carterae.1